jgi:hypothetical protein
MRRFVFCIPLALLAAACSPSPSTSGAGGGCPNDLPQSCPPNAPGYKATIAPIMSVSCVICHQPGGTSTIYLRNHAEVASAAEPVLHEVYSCRMPPPDYPPLTPAARDDLLAWLVCGALDN